MPLSQLFPGAIIWRGINTENSVIRGSGVTLKDINPPFGSVPTSVIPWRPGCSRTSDSFVWLQKRKRWAATNYFLYVFDDVFDHGSYEFQLKYWCLCFFSCKIQVSDPASRDLWCHKHCHISCSNHWEIRKKIVP